MYHFLGEIVRKCHCVGEIVSRWDKGGFQGASGVGKCHFLSVASAEYCVEKVVNVGCKRPIEYPQSASPLNSTKLQQIHSLTQIINREGPNKLTSNSFGPIHFAFHFRLYTFGFEHVGHLVHLHVSHHVHLHVRHHVSHRNIVSTLLEVSETLTEPKSESVMDRRTDRGRCCKHLRV